MAICPDGHQSGSDDFCDVCGLRIGRMSQAQPAGDPWGSPSRAPGGAGPSAQPSGPGGPGAGSAGPVGSSDCPRCGTARTGRFCEGCGLDYTTGRLPDGSVVGAGGPQQAASQPDAPYSPTVYSYPASAPSVVPPVPAPLLPPTWDAHAPAEGGQAASPAAHGTGSVPRWPAGQATTWSVVVSADRAYYDQVRTVSGPDAESIVFPGYCAERQFTLSGGEMRIGRHSTSRGIYPEIDLTGPPTDPGVSRLHAVLVARADGWSVLDPGSANGTQVNGAEIPQNEEVPLRDGDRINVGAWTALSVHCR
jgi:hypothetical protein